MNYFEVSQCFFDENFGQIWCKSKQVMVGKWFFGRIFFWKDPKWPENYFASYNSTKPSVYTVIIFKAFGKVGITIVGGLMAALFSFL